MTGLSAIIPVGSLQAANSTLETAGHGPDNFSVALYDGVRPGFAGLRVWDSPATQQFIVDVKALSGVVWAETADDPVVQFAALCAAQSVAWPANAPLLPDSGVINPGEYYQYVRDGEVEFWRVLVAHDRAIFGGDPATHTTLIVQARIPGQVSPWKQPQNENAYLTLDPFTGEGERVTHNSRTWRCTNGSAGGPGGSLINTFEPGFFGWTDIGPA